MLKIKSFDIKDDVGMNELLSKYRISSGANILISEGKVMIPYEDGLEPSNAQRIALMQEMKLKQQDELGLLAHSNRVLDKQIENIEGQLAVLEKESLTPGTKEAYDKTKDIKDQVRVLENQLSQTKSTKLMNDAEISRLETNVLVFNESIYDLEMEG